MVTVPRTGLALRSAQSILVKTDKVIMFHALSHLVLPTPLWGYDSISVPISHSRLRGRKSLGQDYTVKKQQVQVLVQTQATDHHTCYFENRTLLCSKPFLVPENLLSIPSLPRAAHHPSGLHPGGRHTHSHEAWDRPGPAPEGCPGVCHP